MASPSFDSRPARDYVWTARATCNRAYLLAAVRAGVIALLLLGILALVVWF